MYENLKLFVNLIYIGGLLAYSLFYFVSFSGRKNDLSLLGIALFCLGAGFIFYFRRVYPYPFNNEAVEYWKKILFRNISIHMFVGSAVLYLEGISHKRANRSFRGLRNFYVVFSMVFLACFILCLIYKNSTYFIPYMIVLSLYTLASIVVVLKNATQFNLSEKWKKKISRFITTILTYLFFLAGLTLLNNEISYWFIIFSSYALIFYSIKLHGEKSTSDFYELLELKNSLEKKVQDRTDQLMDMHRKRQTFFANFAHETKTPLTLISNYFSLYLTKTGETPELKIIKRNMDKMLRDIDNFLDLNKFSGDKKIFNHHRIINASALIDEKLDLFEPYMETRGLILVREVAENLSLKADPLALDRIINNLLDNAIKYSNEQGKITVCFLKTPPGISLMIEDEGIGIPEDQQANIFNPYYQITHNKRNSQGLGMGLGIVKALVRELEGFISLESTQGKGTIFKINFPSARGQGRRESTALMKPLEIPQYPCPTPVKPGSRTYTLLVVEDNPELLFFLRESLETEYNVYTAPGGWQALELLEIIPKPHLILSDIMMDEMDGYAFFEELKNKKNFVDVPVIFLTAKSTVNEKLTGLAHGAIDFIRKPFCIEELKEKISSLFRFLENHNNTIKKNTMKRILETMKEEAPREILEVNLMEYNFTKREQEIIRLMIDGFHNKEIGLKLNISTRTVDNHIYNIYKKSGCQNRVELLNRLLITLENPL